MKVYKTCDLDIFSSEQPCALTNTGYQPLLSQIVDHLVRIQRKCRRAVFQFSFAHLRLEEIFRGII